MESGDGLILRVRPRLSRLSLVQLGALGQAADRSGGGSLHLSNRANVLIRGMTAAGHAAALDVLAAANLIDSDPRAEAVRNIMFLRPSPGARWAPPSPARGEGTPPAPMVSPLPRKLAKAGLPTKGAISASGYGRERGRGEGAFAAMAEGLAAKLEHLLTKTEALYRLPAKFGIAVQVGEEIDTAALSDVNFLVQESRIAMLLEGALDKAGVFTGTCEAVNAFLRVALVFLQTRDVKPDIRRMRDAVDRFGLDAIAKDARLALVEHGLLLAAAPAPAGDLGEAFGIAFAFGEIGPAALQEITHVMRQHGIPEAALSPRRALVFPVQEQDKAAFQELAQRIGGITRPDDLRLRVHACPGAPACSRAEVAARRDAEGVLAALGEGGMPEGTIHISGCEKRCAYPHRADITAIGADDGRYTIIGPKGQTRAAVKPGGLAGVVAELAGAL
jgi:precorrin-3B synthase